MKLTTKELRMIIKEELEAVLLEEGLFDMFRKKPQASKKILDKPAEPWSLEAEMDWDPYKFLKDRDVENKINKLEGTWEASGGKPIDVLAMLRDRINAETRGISLDDGNLEIRRGRLVWEWEEELQSDQGWTNRVLSTMFNEKTFQWDKIDVTEENSWERD